MAIQRAQGGDLGQAGRGDPGRVGSPVAQVHLGVEHPHRLHHPRRRPGVQPVGVRHGERPRQRVLRRGVDLRLDRSGGSAAEVRRLAGERRGRLGGDLQPVGPSGGGDGRHDQAFHQRRRAEDHPCAELLVEQFESELGGQHGTAEVHQHDHTGAGVGHGHGFQDLRRIGSERGVVQPGGRLDAHRPAVQHLAGQRNRGAGQRPAVRDDDQADEAGRFGLGSGRHDAPLSRRPAGARRSRRRPRP